ncbi:MAG: AAA domain-containing protein [Desulforegulaceae bacterium]|nr:AAA domain-containing protein [Desulforegulaceae bacterium]
MDYFRNITKYFRQSLIDSERKCPEDKDILPFLGPSDSEKNNSDYISLDCKAWFEGRIDKNLAKEIVKKRNKEENSDSKETELVIYPRVDFLKTIGGKKSYIKNEVLIPLVVFIILDEDGKFKPSPKAPWIPREWISPNQGKSITFTNSFLIDKFLSQNLYQGMENWDDVRKYCTSMLCSALSTEYFPGDPELKTKETSIYDLEILNNDYELKNVFLIQVKEPPVVGAKQGIIKLIDSILDTNSEIPLYKMFCAKSSPEIIPYRDLEDDSYLSKQHLGQMTGEFPLSLNQRNALHHLLKNNNPEILAVNGPPGTGKTTLLRSVVASLWSKAALEETEPPLIAATSNNNQAVTNILESFARVDEKGLEESLKGRWIPEISSYGLYCCSSGKAKESNPYMYLGPKGEGLMEYLHTQEYFDGAVEFFLEKAGKWQNKKAESLKEVRINLHNEIKKTEKAIIKGIDTLKNFKTYENEIFSKFKDLDSLKNEIEFLSESLNLPEKELLDIRLKKDELLNLWSKRKILTNLFIKFKFVQTSEYYKNAILFNKWGIPLEDKSDKSAEKILNEMENQSIQKQENYKKRIGCLQNLYNSYKEASEKINLWIKTHSNIELLSKDLNDKVNEINDRVLRFKLFKLSTHYWEARWLIDLNSFLPTRDSDKKSDKRVLGKLKRFAKLTPCFVSTFYMLPKTFEASVFEDNVWKHLPLYEKIDLLIIDEAGQALPEVSAPCFALAKKALVVGDTDQIEPVWSISPGVDRSNLQIFNLFENEKDYNDFWLESGLTASSGNVMKVAQRQCLYHQFTKLQKGLYLTEHRRCYNSIVNYCNELVYQGVLKPLRGEPKVSIPWGKTMAMVSIKKDSKSYGGSRGNFDEAVYIANWLDKHKSIIVEYVKKASPDLKDIEDNQIIQKSIGIITPFSTQARFIKKELLKKKIKGVTVGTVHSLQGDERLIILFSSVYGESDKKMGKFYDNGPNMLNVAVSRAKDAFVLFGDPDVFGVSGKSSPSGILRSMLSELK